MAGPRRMSGDLPDVLDGSAGAGAQRGDGGGELVDEGAQQPEPHSGVHGSARQQDCAGAQGLVGAPVHGDDRLRCGSRAGVGFLPGNEGAEAAEGGCEVAAVLGAAEGERELGDQGETAGVGCAGRPGTGQRADHLGAADSQRPHLIRNAQHTALRNPDLANCFIGHPTMEQPADRAHGYGHDGKSNSPAHDPARADHPCSRLQALTPTASGRSGRPTSPGVGVPGRVRCCEYRAHPASSDGRGGRPPSARSGRRLTAAHTTSKSANGGLGTMTTATNAPRHRNTFCKAWRELLRNVLLLRLYGLGVPIAEQEDVHEQRSR